MQTCLTDGEAIDEAFRQSRFACLTILLTRLSDILQSFELIRKLGQGEISLKTGTSSGRPDLR